jgi:site-specific DNA recombinase
MSNTKPTRNKQKGKPTKTHANGGLKNAGIYIRVSTERQAEKASPHEQEKACRAYCESRGYRVVEVYRDTEKYRSGGRMVEPSGTRSDRPQLLRMLSAVDAGHLDVIVAWREDRLYRGLRPMLEIIECIERNDITIELATETFDRRMAPIKASIARMELDAIQERQQLGLAGRLSKGLVSPGSLPYGYMAKEGHAVVNPVEADWIVKMFIWYAEGVPIREIRRRLIEGEAPQRQHSTLGTGKVPIAWNYTIVQRYVGYEPYWTGEQPVTLRNGQTYVVSLPVLITPDLAAGAIARRKKNKRNHVRHVAHPFLVAGIAYCEACGVRLTAKSRWRYGHWVLTYACKYHDVGYQKGDVVCCKSMAADKLDTAVWAKVWAAISDDALFEERVQEKVAAMRLQEAGAQVARERLDAALDAIAQERQRIITWARKGAITETDMEMQLGGLELEARDCQRELDDVRLLTSGQADRLLVAANRYRETLRRGGDFLNATDLTPELVDEQYQLRREIIEAIVERVDVLPDKTPVVYLVLDLSAQDQADEKAYPGSIMQAPLG